jgi:hypothetical protein
VLFIWRDFKFNSDLPIDKQKFGQFSDYVGGIIGSIWALAGVILFYVALTDQREDIKNNREVLLTQVKALEQQIEEFALQRDEMKMTRKVFNEQSNTLKKQQFESTFFNSLDLFNNIILDISYFIPDRTEIDEFNPPIFPQPDRSQVYTGRDSFKFFYKELQNHYLDCHNQFVKDNMFRDNKGKTLEINIEDELQIIEKSFEKLFDDYQAQLGHYFRTVYNIIRFVEKESVENSKYYTNLVRAQLSTFEHLLLFYNCLTNYGKENFKPLIIKFSLLDNLSTSGLLDQRHLEFYPEKAYR